ncbi:MAG: tetrahydromethanopterin S-methyltransferase subunit [Archaeoglobaceae archaeon]|nr:tetrahydromethanopterin S-methyltransferase subunit [Archaeoglobaceae archaeon]
MDKKEKEIPRAYVDTSEYLALLERIKKIEEKVEFFQAEVAQQVGKKVGRDIGILYGLVFALIMVVIYLLLKAPWG